MNTQHICDKHCKTRASLVLMQDTAEYYANKYRYDPFLSDLHGKYSDALKEILEAEKELYHV